MVHFGFPGYVASVNTEAKRYAAHASRDRVNVDDIRLAASTIVSTEFVTPPPREVIIIIMGLKETALGRTEIAAMAVGQRSTELPGIQWCFIDAMGALR